MKRAKLKIYLQEFDLLIKKSKRVLKEEGSIALVKKIKGFLLRLNSKKQASTSSFISASEIVSVKTLMQRKFCYCTPIPMKSILSSPRISLILPGFGQECFWGGVATATIFSAYLADELKASLRIITTNPVCVPSFYNYVQTLFQLPEIKKVEFFDTTIRNPDLKLGVSNNDIFVASMWYTSYLCRSLSKGRKFIYFIQEYEPYLYPYGDENLLSRETYLYEDFVPIFNTKILQQFFKDKLKKDYDSRLAFEPAFPSHLYKENQKMTGTNRKKRLFFYCRPSAASRNLFYRGLAIIDAAIEKGILSPKEWEICFAGENIEKFRFEQDIEVKHFGKMQWDEYCKLVSEIDLAISLMDAPHPSYPPLEFAAAGAVVLTNTAEGKEKMHYSKNIIMRDPELNSLLDGLVEAVKLVNDPVRRKNNYKENNIERDWQKTLVETINFVKKNLILN